VPRAATPDPDPEPTFECWPAEPAVIIHANTGYYGYSVDDEWLYTPSIAADMSLAGRWRDGVIRDIGSGGSTTGGPAILSSPSAGCSVAFVQAGGAWPAGVAQSGEQMTTAPYFYAGVPSGLLAARGVYRAAIDGAWAKIWDAVNTTWPFSYGVGGGSDSVLWVAQTGGADGSGPSAVYRHTPGAGSGTIVTTALEAVGIMRGDPLGVYCVAFATVGGVGNLYRITASGAVAGSGITFGPGQDLTDLVQLGGVWIGAIAGVGIYRSTDGLAWTQVYAGNVTGRITPGAALEWWAIRADAATLLRSVDGGVTWTAIPYTTALGSSPPTPSLFDSVIARES
jgi:hypothetical protein